MILEGKLGFFLMVGKWLWNIYIGLERNGKSCRLRWINYLRPGLKRGTFSQEEQHTILSLHHMLGNKSVVYFHGFPYHFQYWFTKFQYWNANDQI